LLCACALSCEGAPKAYRKLILLHTNDEHSHLVGFGPEADDFPASSSGATGAIKGGASRRSVALQAERAAAAALGADTLTVSAGDNMMGTLMQIAATTASPDYRVMKMLKYDVTTLGNHEFDYGPAGLVAAINAAKASAEGLPDIVASNIHFSGTSGDASLAALFDELGTSTTLPIHRTLVRTVPSGLKVGFIGIMGADAAAVAPLKAPVKFSIPPGQPDDNRLAALEQIYSDLRPYVQRLRVQDKVDLVVALSHSGADAANPAKSEDLAIAQNVAGIDVIVSGHSHTVFPATLIRNAASGKYVLVQQAGRFGDNVGRISILVSPEGYVGFDVAGSGLRAVDDKTAASDAAINTFVGGVGTALESQPIPGQSFSFLQYTLAQILGAPPPAKTALGDYYNFSLANLDYDIDNTSALQETELMVLSADSMLAMANAPGIGPTQLTLEAAGVVRVSTLEKGTKSKLGFGDVFRAVPLGGSPVTGTPGYPLCRFGVWLVEVKAAFEVAAGFAYTGHEDLFLVPAGFKFEYDTKRAPFNPNGDPTDRNNGRVTKIFQLKPADLAAGNYDGAYDLKFDASLTTGALPGWLDAPLRVLPVVTSLYMATFATFAGIHLKDISTGAPIPNNDANLTIIKRPLPAPNDTEIKQWEALGSYVRTLAAANAGKLPNRYNKTANLAAKPPQLPRRSTCVGANVIKDAKTGDPTGICKI
jgi:5'-nucleotidase